ncbi:MAG: cell division protein FtsZ [Bacilli bacterium]|jgi:cell division protein FtsZ|nr:cell division protein FtsZ [Bacilli bacterium]
MENIEFEQYANIKVVGVGGGGCNALSRMEEEGIQGVELIIANTDLQVLANSNVKRHIELGASLTKGLGAGADPEIGKKAALESEDAIREALQGADMVFIAAGMGGGTGTGAAPVIAKISKELGALTVGIVTRPFSFEGNLRYKHSIMGLHELKNNVDSLIIISNDKLLEFVGQIPVSDAFNEADKILIQGVQTITDLIAVPAIVNLDFADVKSVMQDKGSALIGIGLGSGDNKAEVAAKQAIASPLLEASIAGAKHAIINVTGGASMTLQDSNDAVRIIEEYAGNTDINVIFGVAVNDNLEDEMVVTVIATGFDLPEFEEDSPIEISENTVENSNDNEVVSTNAVENNQTIDIDAKIANSQELEVPAFIRNR